jgi:polar amino acid transport system substrate-binding protein
MVSAMRRLIGIQGLLCATSVVVWALSGGAAPAEPLRLVTFSLSPFTDTTNDTAPGLGVEVLRQVLATMGREPSFESLPPNRGWMMVARGERDGMFGTLRTSERERICSFPDEPLSREKWVFFIRTADIGKLKFSSLDDLVGHDVAVLEPVPGFEQPTASLELWKFLREHHNMVETNSITSSFRMLAAGRVDYAVANLNVGMRYIAVLGLSGAIEPLRSRSVIEGATYLCFSKARVDPALVDAFSQALKQFKQTEAFRAIYRKYFP